MSLTVRVLFVVTLLLEYCNSIWIFSDRTEDEEAL